MEERGKAVAERDLHGRIYTVMELMVTSGRQHQQIS